MSQKCQKRSYGFVLEHSVRVCRFVWDDLKNVPMFHHFPVFIETKNVYPCIVVAPRPLLMAMEYNEIIFRYCSFEVNLLFGVFRVHSLEVLDERLLTIPHLGIVLDIHITDVFLDGFTRLTLIKHQVVECPRVLFVLLQVTFHFRCTRWAPSIF